MVFIRLRKFPSILGWCFDCKRMLSFRVGFAKWLFCLWRWSCDFFVGVHFSINKIHHIDWFPHDKLISHSWYKFQLVIVYDPLWYVAELLNFHCQCFVEGFCIYSHKKYCSVIFFSCGIFVWYGIRLSWPHRMMWEVFTSLRFLE